MLMSYNIDIIYIRLKHIHLFKVKMILLAINLILENIQSYMTQYNWGRLASSVMISGLIYLVYVISTLIFKATYIILLLVSHIC